MREPNPDPNTNQAEKPGKIGILLDNMKTTCERQLPDKRILWFVLKKHKYWTRMNANRIATWHNPAQDELDFLHNLRLAPREARHGLNSGVQILAEDKSGIIAGPRDPWGNSLLLSCFFQNSCYCIKNRDNRRRINPENKGDL